jgi:hypothetical protein
MECPVTIERSLVIDPVTIKGLFRIAALPRKATFHFDLQAEAREGPHQHRARKDRHTRKCWRCGNSPHDVRPDQHLAPEQDRSPGVSSVTPEPVRFATERNI